MSEHHAAPGPYETEYEARPAVAHILESPEAAWTDGNLRLLEAACAAAGAELGAWDHDTLLVMAGLGPARAASLAGIIARAAQPPPRETLLGPEGVAQPGGGWISGPSS